MWDKTFQIFPEYFFIEMAHCKSTTVATEELACNWIRFIKYPTFSFHPNLLETDLWLSTFFKLILNILFWSISHGFYWPCLKFQAIQETFWISIHFKSIFQNCKYANVMSASELDVTPLFTVSIYFVLFCFKKDRNLLIFTIQVLELESCGRYQAWLAWFWCFMYQHKANKENNSLPILIFLSG